jgi:virulence factor Mce-like protein
MRIKPRIAVNLVGVFLLTVLTVGWVIIRLVAPAIIDKPFTVTADFASSGGVFTNQEVTYRGVLVGKVGTLSLNESGVDIELLIDPEWENEIPESVTARIQSKSAVGEQFVNLFPEGYVSSEKLAEGDTIPRSQTKLPVDFQKLLRTLDAVLADVPPGKTRRLIQNLADGLGGRGDEIASILQSLGTLSQAFASVAPEQQRLLDNATKAGGAFLESKDELVAAMKAADEVLTGIGDEPGELKKLFVQNDRLARAGLKLISRNGAKIHRGIIALDDLTDFQLDNIDVIQDSLTYVPAFLHAVEDASVPWRSPDGRKFYRIRVGLVHDNVPSSWPCKYKLPQFEDPDTLLTYYYERLPHVRTFLHELGPDRSVEPVTGAPCIPQTTTSAAETESMSLIEALRILLAEHAARESTRPGGSPRPGGEPPAVPGWLEPPPEEQPQTGESPSPEGSPSPSPSQSETQPDNPAPAPS